MGSEGHMVLVFMERRQTSVTQSHKLLLSHSRTNSVSLCVSFLLRRDLRGSPHEYATQKSHLLASKQHNSTSQSTLLIQQLIFTLV